jgi:hypothetical protein
MYSSRQLWPDLANWAFTGSPSLEFRTGQQQRHGIPGHPARRTASRVSGRSNGPSVVSATSTTSGVPCGRQDRWPVDSAQHCLRRGQSAARSGQPFGASAVHSGWPNPARIPTKFCICSDGGIQRTNAGYEEIQWGAQLRTGLPGGLQPDERRPGRAKIALGISQHSLDRAHRAGRWIIAKRWVAGWPARKAIPPASSGGIAVASGSGCQFHARTGFVSRSSRSAVRPFAVDGGSSSRVGSGCSS